MHRGYVKLWRKSVDSPIFQNDNVWRLWTYLLMKATHRQTQVLVGTTPVDLQPGQMVFGRNKAKDETGMTEQKIRTSLKCLERLGNLTIQTTNRFSIVTICNWGIYQSEESPTNQPTNQQLTSNQPATNQQLTTYKNSKNNKKEDMCALFDEFWTAYDLKKNRKKAEQAWRKTQPEDRPAIITAAKKYRATITDQQYQKHATTWLNGECWNDDVSQPEPTDAFAPAETMTDDERNALLEKMQHMTPAEAEAHRRFDAEREKLQAIWIEAGLDL